MIYRRKDQYIDSIGSENKKTKPEDDYEVLVLDFSYQYFIGDLTASLKGLGISIRENEVHVHYNVYTTMMQDSSTATI